MKPTIAGKLPKGTALAVTGRVVKISLRKGGGLAATGGKRGGKTGDMTE